MARFRELLTGLGYADAATLLNSGNAAFRATRGAPSQHAADIASALTRALEIEVPVVVRSAAELAAIVAECPLAADASDHARLLVAFAQEPAALSALAPVERLVVAPERFALGNHAAYLLCANGILQSRAGAALLGKAGRSATTRNWATVLKLQALATDVARRDRPAHRSAAPG